MFSVLAVKLIPMLELNHGWSPRVNYWLMGLQHNPTARESSRIYKTAKSMKLVVRNKTNVLPKPSKIAIRTVLLLNSHSDSATSKNEFSY